MNEQIIRTATLLPDESFRFAQAERQLLRTLAGEVSELAARPLNSKSASSGWTTIQITDLQQPHCARLGIPPAARDILGYGNER